MIQLTDDQLYIKRRVINHVTKKTENIRDKLTLITGVAGTGKSTLTSSIIKELDARDYKVKATAPTHKATSVIRTMIDTQGIDVPCSTIFSHLRLKIVENHDNGKVSLFPDYNKDHSLPRLDILIIDEFRMVGPELWTHLLNSLQKDEIKHVILVGDDYQLPSVEDGEFSLINEVLPENIHHLTEIIRQASENPIIQLSQVCVQEIKQEGFYQDALAKIIDIVKSKDNPEIRIMTDEHDFMTKAHETEDSMVLSFTNRKVNIRNEILRNMARYEEYQAGTLLPYMRGDILVLQNRYEKNHQTFMNNQEVKVLSATVEQGLFKHWKANTDEGILHIIHEEAKGLYDKTINELKSQATHEKNGLKRSELWRKFFTVKGMYADVKYNYAGTLHKSQGSTYNNVFLDLTDMFGDDEDLLLRLLYVGITRASKGLYILVPKRF